MKYKFDIFLYTTGIALHACGVRRRVKGRVLFLRMSKTKTMVFKLPILKIGNGHRKPRSEQK